ncbi:type I restriction endonuclease [Massilibacteroides sp.]|uniref:type I restriction endonuclease n=1 Tax=Massilibacteroides sp. TaxID=2034766 RepID=UPI002633E262|nr:type I restriction endonuclease [Massilibacteroides sp.]MDD4516590.1 type I restriction endonuclease [Massilibacteroides sp.]
MIKHLSDRIEKLKDNIQTEEATKNAFVMPFVQSLGYDVFNPLEVVPEFTCDIGTKKGEKVDYAILKDNQPIILIECKNWNQDLNLFDNQLLRYFHVTNAKFGLLTNGIIYRFYTDLEVPNRMDEKPFLEVNLLNIKSNQIDEIKKFHKTYFDLDNILSSASELKYTGELKNVLNKEFNSPSPEFTKYLTKMVYPGTVTAKVLEQFEPLVKKSISGLISDAISDRLNTALKTEKEEQEKEIQLSQKDIDVDIVENKIITTKEELEAFYIVKSIIRPVFRCDRIFYRDAQSYFSVLVDDNNRKPVCRLYLNSPTNWQISFVGDDKKEVKYKIQSLDEIYNYAEEILGSAGKFIILE